VVDNAQPATAAEAEPVSREDALQQAASAFKVNLGQEEEAPERARGPDGKFVSTREPEEGEEVEEIEATEEADEAGAGAESQGEEQDGSEDADEAQPRDPSLPKSWSPEKVALWETLDPDAQAYIRQRDAEQETAVNTKFMEAANLRKAHEAEISAANATIQNYGQAAELVLSLVQPQRPPRSMLDINSGDYDPDNYHFLERQYEDQTAFLNQHAAQLGQIRAQEQQQKFNAINTATRDKFIEAVPDVADQAKAPAVFQGLIDYAVSIGMPAEVFDTPTTAGEWLVLHKAKEYDRLQAAKAKVRSEPKPPPKPQPAVRPGVTTPRSAIEKANKGKAMDRLARSGSVQDGAAVLKHLMKGLS
jgi:hypothetical protein